MTLNVAHVSLTMQVPGIGKAIAYGEVYSSVNVRIANNSGILPTATATSPTALPRWAACVRSVSASLEDKKLLGLHVFVEDVAEGRPGVGTHLPRRSRGPRVQPCPDRGPGTHRRARPRDSINAVDFGQRISTARCTGPPRAWRADYVVLTEMHATPWRPNAAGLVSDVHPRKKIPRIRPEIPRRQPS